MRVMDAVGIEKAVVIGSSAAGEEMHFLGARHSARVRGLVYVDAAFNRGDDADEEVFNAAARLVPSAPGPQDSDRVSFAAFGQSYTIRAILKGPNGEAAAVVSVWFIRAASGVPHFVTAYPGGDQ